MQNYKITLLVVDFVFPFTAAVFICLRLQSKRVIYGRSNFRLQADDWLVITAMLFAVAWTTNVAVGISLGDLGSHTGFDLNGMPKPGRANDIFMQTIYAAQIIVIPALGFTKLSLLALYSRIFNTHRFQTRTWLPIAIIIAQMVSFSMAIIFQCRPISNSWNLLDNTGCVNYAAITLAIVCGNTLTDLLTLCWPILEIYRLQMSLRTKLAAMFMFLLGGFVVVVGAVRIYFVAQEGKVLANPRFADINQACSTLIMWTTIEIDVGIICACLPTLRPVYRHYHLDMVFDPLRSFLSSIRLNGSRSDATSGAAASDEIPLTKMVKEETMSKAHPV